MQYDIPVTPEEILAGRDARAERQQRLLRDSRCVVSFCLNIPGPLKLTRLTVACFEEGERRVEALVRACGFPVQERLRTILPTGPELCLGMDADAAEVKQMLLQLEETHPLGRLFDLDVLDAAGEKLSRAGFGLEPRGCLICGENAFLCRRSGRHSTEDLAGRANAMIQDFLDEKDAEFISSQATLALLREVAVSPKPGLVDRFSSGAHPDMDYDSFQRSAAALAPWFCRFVMAGAELRGADDRLLFRRLRVLGQQAEEAMFSATGGCNTHKGIIFSFSLLCGALGALSGENRSAEQVLKRAGQLAAPALEDFYRPGLESTHGRLLWQQSEEGGIRQEAARGFPSVLQFGLPAIKKARAMGLSQNDVGVMVLLNLAAHVRDSNVLYRGGEEGLAYVRSRCAQVLKQLEDGAPIEAVQSLDREFTRRKLSPGGCADLLAVTLFLDAVNRG